MCKHEMISCEKLVLTALAIFCICLPRLFSILKIPKHPFHSMHLRFIFFFYFLNWAVWLLCLFSSENVLVKILLSLLGLGLLLVCLMHSSQGCIFFYSSHKLMVSGASFHSCFSGFWCSAPQAWMAITVWLSLMLVTPHRCHSLIRDSPGWKSYVWGGPVTVSLAYFVSTIWCP